MDGEIHLKALMTWSACLLDLLLQKKFLMHLLGALETGTTVIEEFIKKRIIDTLSVDFYDSLSKNNLNTFKSIAAATKVKVNGQLELLKADRILFAILAVIKQTRSMDMREVLSHSLGPVPWSLATTDGNLAKNKSQN